MSDDSSDREGRGWILLLLGPAVTLASVCVLWKNETRFDYYDAARKTSQVDSLDEARDGESISFTGSMDRTAKIVDDYVIELQGYLTVQRDAEIYCWHYSKKSGSRSSGTWYLEWKDKVESNQRNSGVSQRLSSRKLLLDAYRVGELPIDARDIDFVDESEVIMPSTLTLRRQDLQASGQYLHLHKHAANQLGDERVRYTGIKIPEQATYFGIFSSGKGIADTSQRRTGWISELIHDTGVLHHVVAQDRDTALRTMSGHLSQTKWLIRLAGTGGVVFGIFLVASKLLGLLLTIPLLGPIAETGIWVGSLAIGLPIAFITILAGYLVSHPLLLVVILILSMAAAYWIKRRGTKNQAAIRNQLQTQYGQPMQDRDLKEWEFMELAQLALSDHRLELSEQQFLRKWAKKHDWDDDRYYETMERAKTLAGSDHTSVYCETHLSNLIRLSMADSKLTRYEFNTIKHVASFLGIKDDVLKKVIKRVRNEAS